MKIGVPKETAADERRVALVPDVVRRLTGAGHEVVIEPGAGAGAGVPDGDYTEAGARGRRPLGRAGDRPRRAVRARRVSRASTC